VKSSRWKAAQAPAQLVDAARRMIQHASADIGEVI
jgi:hypothetical protein